MRILHTVQLYYPHPGGSEQVVRQLSEGLAQRGHDVTVATGFDPRRDFEVLNGVRVVQFKVRGNVAVGIQGEDKKKYMEFVAYGKWDIMLNYAAQIWSSDLVFPLLADLRFAKVFVPCGYSALRRPLVRLLYWKYFWQLPRFLRLYDAIVYHTEIGRDKAFGDRHGVNRCCRIIPNGVSEAEFTQHPIDFRDTYRIETKYLLLNVSNHLWAKGHQFVIKAFKLLGRDDVTLVILGGNPTECYKSCLAAASSCGGRIKVPLGIPRSHIVSAFVEADVFVFASQVEYFPLVLVESMASKTPFVTTDVGNVRELKGGIIIRTPEEMARCVNQLLDNPSARERLGKEGYAHWKERYRWEQIVVAYESLYRELTGKS